MKSKSRIDTTLCLNALMATAIVAIIVFCFSSGISGNDFWWHVKAGEFITKNHTVPTTDIFSWVGMEKGISWTAHEWLSEVIFYFIFHAAGEAGIFLLSLLSAIFMTFLLWKEAKESIRENVLIGGLFLGLFAVLTSLFFYGRPHIFGFFLLFFELKLLYGFLREPESKKVFFIPVLAVLWSNLHGGSSNLSYILCLLFLATGAVNAKFGRIQSTRLEKKTLLKLGFVSVLTVAAIWINPVGGKVFLYPYQSFGDSISMAVIGEWQPPDAKLIGNLILYFVPVALLTVGMMAGEKKIEAIDLAVMALFLFLFFRSARFIIMWYIAAAFYGLKYLPECKVKPMKHAWEKIAVTACAVLLFIPIGYGVQKTADTLKKGGLIRTVMSDRAVAAIKEDAPQRLFNDYNLGEALIYHDIPVFFDARADLYAQENIMADGVGLLFLQQADAGSRNRFIDAEKMIKKYQIDSMVILKERPLYSFLISHPEKYTLIYEDAVLAYYRVRK